MKKIKITALIFLGVCFPAMVFGGSVDNEDDPGSSITVTDEATDPALLTFNFSPSVCGTYITPDDDGNVQSWTLGTYHSGGTLFYGTASDQAIVYKKKRETNDAFAAAGFPEFEGALGDDETVTPWDDDESGWEK